MGINWELLKIEPTKDKDVISKAYKAELRKTNPEDNPEGFKALRAAYEEALKYAKADDGEDTSDKTEIDLWIDSLTEIYDDFQKRINPECWKGALAAKVCESIESGEKAFESLMDFLMEHYFLPQSVWQVLDARFELQSRHDELCEKWAPEFIDYVVMPSISNPDRMPFGMFEPGRNASECDQLRRLYRQACNTPGAEALKIIRQTDDLSETHPYVRSLKNTLIVEAKESGADAALADEEVLYKAYPDNKYIRNEYMLALNIHGDYEKCEALCEEIIAEGKGDYSICNTYSNALVHQGKLEKAYDVVNDEMKSKEHSLEEMAGLQQIRSIIADKILEDISVVERKDDNEYYKNLVWYAMSSSSTDYDRAKEFASHLDPETMDPFDYNYIMSAIYTSSNEYDKVVACNEELIEHIKAHMNGTGIEAVQMRNRLASMYCSQFDAYARMGDKEGAEKYMNIALSEFPENEMIAVTVAKTRLNMKDYEGARKVSEMMLKADSLSFFGWYFLGQSAYGMWDDQTAFEAGFRVAQIVPGELMGFILQLRVLARNNAFDQMKETLDYIKENKIGDPKDLRYFELALIEREDMEKAFDGYLELFEEMKYTENQDEEPFYADEIKARLSELFDERIKAFRRQEKAQEAVAECIRCCELLNIPCEDSPLLSVYKQFGMWDEADALLDNMAEKYPLDADYQRVELELSKKNIEKAREIYNSLKGQGLSETSIVHNHFLRIDGNLKKQKEFWKKKLKVAKEQGGNLYNEYSSLGFVCRQLGDWLGARKYAKLSLGILEKIVENDPVNEPLYRTHIAWNYATLGNFELADTEINKTRKCKLCSFCEYSECKDSYIFELIIEMLKGNYEKAHEIAQFGMNRWPDEVDFICLDHQMMSMGVLGK